MQAMQKCDSRLSVYDNFSSEVSGVDTGYRSNEAHRVLIIVDYSA